MSLSKALNHNYSSPPRCINGYRQCWVTGSLWRRCSEPHTTENESGPIRFAREMGTPTCVHRLIVYLYAELLQIDAKRIPDPIGELKSGWIGEKKGALQWPPVSYKEIADWLLNEAPCTSEPRGGNTPLRKSLHQRLLSDYKGKAYSYFQSHWLQ